MVNAQGKLSQQIVQTTKPTSRLTRTERLRVELRKKKATERIEKAESLKKEAEKVQQEKFSNITSVEEYEEAYASLSPQLKTFFATPEEIRTERSQRIETTKEQVKERVSYADQKLKELLTEYEEDLEKSRERRWRDSSDRREYQREIKDDYEEEKAYWENYKKGLNEGLVELNKNKDYEYKDIESYAHDFGRYEKLTKSRKNRAIREERRKQETLEEAIKETQTEGGRFERVTFSQKGVEKEQKIYAISPEGKRTLISTVKPTQDLTLTKPSALKKATVTQVYKIGEIKLTFKGIEKLYTTKSGALVTAFGELGTTEEEVLKSQKLQAEKEQEERKAKAEEYLQVQQFEEKASKTLEDKRSWFQKGTDYLKGLYGMTIFGTSLKLPEEYHEQRKPFDIKFLFEGKPSPLYSLPFEVAHEGVKAERRKKEEAKYQAELVGELGKLVEEAPEEIKYEVQQKGVEILERREVKSTFDEKTGIITFTSTELTPSKSYNIYEYEFAKKFDEVNKAKWYVTQVEAPEREIRYRGALGEIIKPRTVPAQTTTISPVSVGVKARIVGTKALEFYVIGKGIGAVLGGIGKVTSGTYKGLGGGLKITEATVRGGKVTATVSESTILGGKLGAVAKTVGLGTLFVTGGGLYAAGKIRQQKEYEATYGEVGKEVFKYETIGELAGIGALVGEGLLKKAAIRRANEEIARRNYLRQLEAERIKSIRQYGQYSRYAEVSYKGMGRGKKLSEADISQLAKVYSRGLGISESKATTLVRESALYKQTLKVKSPVGFKPYVSERYAIVHSQKTAQGSKEIALEFTKRGTRLQNIAIKTTTGQGKYALTSIFEKARYAPTQPTKEFRLQQTVISKIIKAQSKKGGETTLRVFDIENRLIKTYPYGKERLELKEALRLGLPRYKETELTKIFQRAGESARISPLPIRSFRVESPYYRDIGQGIKVADVEREYQFIQAGKGGRQVAIKNILRDADFKRLEIALKAGRTRTPLTATFGGTQETIKSSSVAVAKTLTKTTTETTVKNIQVSPTVKTALKTKVINRLIASISPSVATSVSPALISALYGSLGLRTRDQLKTELRARQVTQQAQAQRQIQETQQTQQQRIKAISPTVPYFSEPSARIVEIVPTPTITTKPPVLPKAFILKKDIENLLKDKREKRRIKKGIEVFYDLPDFTSRILGISPKTVGSEQEALREIKRIKTGLELRRGLRIK